jgi:hypothetical protein
VILHNGFQLRDRVAQPDFGEDPPSMKVSAEVASRLLTATEACTPPTRPGLGQWP